MSETSQIINTIVTVAISNVVSGLFIGAGIALGSYFALKKFMPKWIHEISSELIKMKTIDKAVSMRQQYN